ncbi:MAG: spondin domain-containing protein [Gemmataceae bacterium]
MTIENLSPTNSTSFAPLRLGFHNGTFDAFNIGSSQSALSPITTIAEGGSGSTWFPAFQAAEPNAVLGSVGGALLPGQRAAGTFRVDSAVNPFFTFGTMVIPSNDLFLGNDSPIRLFDANGNLLLTQINQFGRSIWDNGSERPIPANAAFLVGSINDNRVDQNGVVSFDFSELNNYNGLTTAAGYTFNDSLTGDTPVYRISFTTQAVPEPASVTLLAVGAAGVCGAAGWRRFRRRAA